MIEPASAVLIVIAAVLADVSHEKEAFPKPQKEEHIYSDNNMFADIVNLSVLIR